ncbi:MAG: hypothetical protein COB37_08915 [Kordiimonadales bacterium]|nr:MAG: hypothetical protein COB37_08915 [Kordiimonadales bacterium]
MSMFRIAANEFRYMFKSPQTLVGFLIFFALPFFAMISTNVRIGGGGNVLVNSPHAITQTLLIMSVFAIFVIPAFIANSVLKDVDHKFDGILFATPISKSSYLFGRFFGSFAALMLALSGIPLGMLVGTFWPSVDPETLAPTNIGHYLTVYFGFVLPSMLTFAAMIFAAAVISRSIMYTYLVAMGLLILYLVGNTLLNAPEYREITALLDPFMLSTFGEATRYFTAVERNAELISYEGVVLYNRLIWFGISAAFVVLAYSLFSFRTPAKMAKEKKDHLASVTAKLKEDIVVGFKATPVWSRGTELQQFILRTKFEVMSVLKSLPFLVIMGFSLFLLITALISRNVGYGLDAYPVTRLMINAIQGGLGLALIVVLIFYSADIIWRERKDKFNEIMDAVPAPNWVFVGSKLIALAFVLFSILVLGIIMSMIVQVLSGYGSLEISLYLHRGLIHFITPFILIAVLACFLQVVSKNRFLGMMLMVVFLISNIILANLGFEHPLYQFAGGIATPLSDMNGSGRFIEGDYWLQMYWTSFAVLMLMFTYLLWNRGTLQPLKFRLRNMRAFKKPALALPAFAAFAAFIGTGSFIYYNTNILNDYVTADDIELQQVAYEAEYRQYENLPMPRTIDIKIDVDIFPYQRRVETRSTQIIQNKTDEMISTVHLVFPPGVTSVPLVEIEGATQVSVDEAFRYYIFDLDTPMVPGEKRTLKFETLIDQKGFSHARNSVTLVRNGTFINNFDITPYIGFNPAGMLGDRNTRREYDLEPLPRTAKLEDVSQHGNNYIRQDSDFVTFETTVSTVASQTVISPGYLEKEWVEGDRRYYTYKMDAPIMNFYSYLSAEYEVVAEKWNGIDIEVYHHKPHAYNVSRMVQSVKDSITYFNTAFSPYQHRQVRILEFPSYRNFAQAFPNTIPYSEGIGFVAEIAGEGDIDLPYYVTAHEMAHQWWAHQVMSANTQGGTMLVETLAQYGALLVMEQKYGKDQIRKFLKFELDRYLGGRAGDPEGELPLYRVENQQYIHYRKGSVIMYALKDYVGEDVVNRSLQRLIALRGFKSQPYAISTDFLTILKEEAGPEHLRLIEDFFEKITLYDVKVTESTVEEMEDGRFKVLLDVEVAKFYADSEGAETEADFDIPVDIGLFLKSPAAAGYGADDVIMLEKRRITEAKSTIEIIVDQKPTFAGIDPYNKLIDRNSNDNLRAVVAAGEGDETAPEKDAVTADEE